MSHTTKFLMNIAVYIIINGRTPNIAFIIIFNIPVFFTTNILFSIFNYFFSKNRWSIENGHYKFNLILKEFGQSINNKFYIITTKKIAIY